MCGIVGLFGPPDKRMFSVFETMLTVDILRGKDSTGVASVGSNGIKIAKEAIFPLELMRTREYRENILSNTDNAFAYIGHNRAATRGEVIKKNAHPFHVNHIVMVHNGTLNENLKPEGDKTYRTDSLSLANAIGIKGIHWTWKELFGPAAVVFYDTQNKTYNFITNGHRPLHFAYTKGCSHLLVASEDWTIRDVCNHHGIKLDKDAVYWPKSDQLWTFNIEENGRIGEMAENLPDRYTRFRHTPTTTTFVQKQGGSQSEPPLLLERPNRQAGRMGTGTSRNGKGNTSTSIQMNHGATEPTLEELVLGIGWFMAKDVLSDQEWDKGNFECAFCNEDLSKDRWTSVVLDDDIAICRSCALMAVQKGGKFTHVD